MSPESRPIEPPLALARIEAALAHGELACLPSETAYVLAANARDPHALAALVAAAAPERERPLAWLVASASALAGFARRRPLAERLARAYWPGPLTLVLRAPPESAGAPVPPLAHGGELALRCSAAHHLAGLAARLPF